MSERDYSELIKEEKRKQEELIKKIEERKKVKEELLMISQNQQDLIKNFASREIDEINTESDIIKSAYIAQAKEIEEAYINKIEEINQSKVTIERQLEEESEFIVQSLHERINAMDKKCLELQERLNNRRAAIISTLHPNDIAKKRILSLQEKCDEIAKSISLVHREIEGLFRINQNLVQKYETIQSGISQKSSPKIKKQRRFSSSDVV